MECHEIADRSAVSIKPKQPFADWLNKIFPDEKQFTLKELLYSVNSSVYLIPPADTPEEVEEYLAAIFDSIFSNELITWVTVDSLWPQNRTFELFKSWFSWDIAPIIFDLAEEHVHDEDCDCGSEH
ncbi:MAG: hypothetical protein PHV30_05225 [Candidatus Margulisbacteria bacterium]|nr:hypothetical protein [Candidatus Margulisiibacteriota bacterium]